MLMRVKLFSYYFHFSRLKIERDFPEENAYKKALSAEYWLVSYILAALLYGLLLYIVDYGTIATLWPYDFGREHGKNFIAPAAIFFVVVWYLTRWVFLVTFFNERTIAEIEEYYGSDSIENKEHSYLINVDTFLCFVMTTCIVFHVWTVFVLCVLAFISQEIWIRKRFSRSD
ncbi:hypothetical protein AB4179_24680 [Vibrio lentus]